MKTKETNEEMFIISSEQVKSLADRLRKSGGLESGLGEVKKMMEIKSVLLWRADHACACIGPGPMNRLDLEMQILQDVLAALEQGDVSRGASLLSDYAALIF
jgi:hypothetical protein